MDYPPLVERVVRTGSSSLAIAYPVPSSVVSRGVQYKRWSEDRMTLTTDALLRDGLSVRREYDVPTSTLGDRISGRMLPGSVSGPGKYSSSSEEEELARFLLQCALIGYPRSCQEVIAIIQRLCNQRGTTKHVSHGWWESFCHCHQNLMQRVTAPFFIQSQGIRCGVVNKYFDVLETTLLEYDLLEKPCQLFSIDETGMPLDPKPLRLVCCVGTKNPASVCGDNKSQVRCVSAAGYCIPSMVRWTKDTEL